MTNLLKQLLFYKSKIINQFPNFNSLSVIPKYQSTHFYTFNELFEEVYAPVDLKIKVATVDYDSEIKEAYKNYLFDFILCLNLINDKSLDTSIFSLSDFEKSSPLVTVENRIRLIFSPLWKYIFPPINARDSSKNCRSHDLYKKDVRIEYYTILHHVSRALRLYSKDCPFGFFIKIPKEALIDYNAQVNYLYSTPTPLHVFNQYFYDLFSRIPGGLPMASEYYAHIQDATYKNTNLTANKINTYYKGFYNSILSSLNDDNTTQQTLFDFFISELLLNGTFIYYFADIFSGSSAANLTRNISDNDFISFFNQLNQMNNFF